MLHDPRHDKEPSLAGFALFVASKDAGERYDYTDCRICAVGQYLASIGKDLPLAQWKDDVWAANVLASNGDWTFGKLADRILAHQMAREKVSA